LEDTYESIIAEYSTDQIPVTEANTAAEDVEEQVHKASQKPRPRKPTPARRLRHKSSTGVWIPREVYEDPRFESVNEMILYLEVNYLDQEKGCTAKNKHFAEYLGCSVQTIQDMIQEMTRRSIFECSYPSRTSRVIHVVGGRRSYPRHRGV
jgi:hypothetical protein